MSAVMTPHLRAQLRAWKDELQYLLASHAMHEQVLHAHCQVRNFTRRLLAVK